MRLLFLPMLLLLPISVTGRGGGRGRSGSRGGSMGGSRGSKGGGMYANPKSNLNSASYNARGHHMYQGSSGTYHGGIGGAGGGGQPYVRKTTSSFYRAGIGSLQASSAAKASITVAALPLVTRVFGNNVIREKETPLKADGKSYYWSAAFVPKSDSSTICSITIDANDTHFSNITFTNLEKVSELAWSCDSSSSYCCGLTCCRDGYEGTPLGIVGQIGDTFSYHNLQRSKIFRVMMLLATALLIPAIALFKCGELAFALSENKASPPSEPSQPEPNARCEMEKIRTFYNLESSH
ncbi:hypothetical protein PENTCL1PPCAC_10745 [Pristionchus entomophagus]|uniref:CX domain-containing protein n=1 Tax=Pristionchus entomophagus TaxID=358040 RepID=A0AAV5T0K1_9BILA|nr:hypothetical protein PENTCL1PPCAC_10745 [Pristionchus entomophagus]